MMGWQDAPLAAAEPVQTGPAWARAPLVRQEAAANEMPLVSGGLRQHFESANARPAGSFEDYLKAGFQQSVTGLAARGKAPDVAITEDTPWYGRIASGGAALAGDFPAMIGGALLAGAGGAPGGPLAAATGVAGAFALPAGLRAVMMDAYTKGEIVSASDFVSRALGVAWETGKGWLTGAATGGAGAVVRGATVAAPVAVRALAPTAAEIATMTTVGRALEGQLPEPQDFLDAALVLGAAKGAGGAVVAAGRLRAIYAKTGVRPEQVLADAVENPAIKEEILAPERAVPLEQTVAQVAREWNIPTAYEPLAISEVGRAIVPGDKAVAVANSPFADATAIKGEPKPTHVNYNYISSAEDTKLALARLSEVYETEIQSQRRGTVSWEETSNEAAKMLSDTLGGVDTKLLMPREPGTAAGAAEILARKQLTIGAAEAMMGARDDLLAKGVNATPEDKLLFLASVERASMIQSEFLGARSEVGRALNILKSSAIEADRAKQIQQVIDLYGGKDPVKLAEMLQSIDTPSGVLKFADLVTKASTWEKVVEAWKAGILSGPVTHMANMLGNGVFAAMRVPVDAVASGLGQFHGGERVSMVEPLARLTGLLAGTMDGLRIAAEVLKTGEQPGKAEQFRTAIGGKLGEIVRLPFRFLSAEDALFKTMNERGEAYTLAVRQAVGEGFNPLTREFRERVVSLVEKPTDAMTKAIDEAGTRFTFNADMGEIGTALQKLVKKSHTEPLVPFIRTPGNILEEMARMTPLAPLVKGWRADIAKGGVARDKAIAEVMLGTGISVLVFTKALDGGITGAGEPDAGKRHVQQAAGWQPYSIKIGGTYYNYQRLQPIGTLIGMAADVAEVWDHLNEEEMDKIPKMLSVAFANAVTNQTALQGITSIFQVMADPQRYGPKFVQQYAGSVVPNIVGQTTTMLDPVTREVYSMLDAVKARIPVLRGDLMPKRDIYGEPVQTKERLGAISPVTETDESTDKVRTEAARLGLSVADTPKKTHIGRGSGKLGDVKLEPDERDRFADVGGHLAHQVLSNVVNSPAWDDLPDMVKKNVYRKVFSQAHQAGAQAAIPLEKRLGLINQITEKVVEELTRE